MKCAIVPFRDRDAQLDALLPRLQAHFDRIVIAEQGPGHSFNRGAIKNAGVLHSEASPTDTLYFHDVDLMPGRRFPGYPNAPNDSTIVHMYGHRHCLGGIIGMRRCAFDALGGFVSKWTWGGEDTDLQVRAMRHGLKIDRSLFTLRFQNDAVMVELDDSGGPMPGKKALGHFMARYEKHRHAAEPSGTYELVFSRHGRLHAPDDGLVHVVYDVK